jgi:hypothetical protein
MIATRRSLLKLGMFSALALATAGVIYRTVRNPAPPAPLLLDAEARVALRAISAAMLKGTLADPSGAALDAALAGAEAAIAGLPLYMQKELQDLFALLLLGPTRRFVAGLPDDWAQVKPQDVNAFLQSWRTHRLGMLQGAYLALHDLILGPWYADPANWAAIGYPGPALRFSGAQS